MARPTDIITRFVLEGLSGVVSTSRRIETTIRGMASRAGTATVDLARRAGTAIRTQFASVASASVGEAQRRIEQVGKSLKDLSKTSAKISFKGIEKGAKASFAAIGFAAAAATAKVAALTTAAVKMTESSSDDLAALNQQSKETGLGISDLTTLQSISKAHGNGPDDLFSSLQNVAGTVREIEGGLSDSGDAVSQARRFLQLGLPIAARAGDADTINTLIAQSKAAGNTNLEAVQWRMQRLEQRIRSIQSGPISGRLYGLNVKNATDQAGLAAMRRAQEQMISPLIAEFQELTEVAKGLRESMGPAGRALEDLKDVGLDAQKVIGGGTGALLEIAGALEKIDEKAKKTEIVRGLFGDTAALPVLLEGRAGIARYHAEKERYGGVETQADGERSTKLKRAELRRNDAIDGLKLSVAREISPLLEETNNQFAEWLAKNRLRIARYVKETFVAVRAVLYDIGKLFEGKTDFDTALFKKGAAVIEWAKTTFATVKDFVVSVGGEIYTQLTKIFSGMDSDWAWLNKVRDAFLSIKSFATDAFAVLTGGEAKDFTWLNELSAAAKNFFVHLQAAWGMFRKVLDTIHQAIKPILSFFNTDVLTAALFVGMLRLSGILGGILTAGRGLLGIFTPALAGIGIAAAAAAGQVALIGAALLSAWKLGEWIGGKLAEPFVERGEKTREMIAETMRLEDEARFLEKLKRAGPDERITLLNGRGYFTGQKSKAVKDRERAELLKNFQGVVINGDGSTAEDSDSRYRAAKMWEGRQGQNFGTVNFVTGGKTVTGLFSSDAAQGLMRGIKQTMRTE